jgi:hypothetical protein
MSTKTEIHLIDDIDGTKAARTITFALDRTTFEIDLSDDNADRLGEALMPFIAAARPVKDPGAATSAPRSARKASAGTRSRTDQSDVRTWARANGWPTLGDRGRMPADALAAYRAAHPAVGA